jgi:hypothetical protein
MTRLNATFESSADEADDANRDCVMRIIMARCGDVLTDADLAALGNAPNPDALPESIGMQILQVVEAMADRMVGSSERCAPAERCKCASLAFRIRRQPSPPRRIASGCAQRVTGRVLRAWRAKIARRHAKGRQRASLAAFPHRGPACESAAQALRGVLTISAGSFSFTLREFSSLGRWWLR